MDELPADAWLGAFIGFLWLASIATWIGLYTRWQRRGAILDYEPRSPVPWGLPVALLTVLFVTVSLASSIAAGASTEPANELSTAQVCQRLLGFIIMQTVLTTGVLFVVAVVYRARWRDFGLPISGSEFIRDVWTGIIASFAAILPVHGIQLLLLYLSGLHEAPPGHPLIKMVTGDGPNLTLLSLASIAAVVIAPLSEEILFRLLLQGWLEKWEDKRLGWRAARDSTVPTTDESPTEGSADWANDEARLTNDEVSAFGDPSFVIRHSSLENTIQSDQPVSFTPPPRGIAGLRYGVAPILISAILFAAAHFGYGPDPVAIFFLAIILGYVYQRTHRIIPSIVAHALFNSLAMLVLWRMVLVDAK